MNMNDINISASKCSFCGKQAVCGRFEWGQFKVIYTCFDCDLKGVNEDARKADDESI